MTEQHRATNLQWACIKARTCGESDVVAYSTIHELLCRIEALEAAQQAHSDASHLIDPEKEKMAQEFMQAAGFAPRPTEPRPREVAARIRAAADARAKSNHPEIPDSSLMVRVALVIENGIACDRDPERIARDVIRAATAWMREQRLEQEAER